MGGDPVDQKNEAPRRAIYTEIPRKATVFLVDEEAFPHCGVIHEERWFFDLNAG